MGALAGNPFVVTLFTGIGELCSRIGCCRETEVPEYNRGDLHLLVLLLLVDEATTPGALMEGAASAVRRSGRRGELL